MVVFEQTYGHNTPGGDGRLRLREIQMKSNGSDNG